MKKSDKKKKNGAESAKKSGKRPFPIARARDLRRLGRRKGLLRGAVRSPLLAWIGKHLDLDRELAAAYAALFAEAIDHNGLADLEAVAERHSLKGEARLPFTASVEKLRQSGLVVVNRGKASRSILMGSMVELDAVVFVEILHGKDSDSRVDFDDPLAVIGEADELLHLSHDHEISRQMLFSSLSRLAAKSAGRNPLGAWLKGLPAVEMALFFMAASTAAVTGRAYDLDDFFRDCQLPMGEKGLVLRLINDGRALAAKRRLVKFKNNDISQCLAFKLGPGPTQKLFPRLRNADRDDEDGDKEVVGLKLCPEKPTMLFLPAGLAKELAALERACAPAGFRRFASGLRKAGLPPGLTILLHGAPGTGKTVAALNLAHAAGRSVLQVDMSQLRDKYVGESEKNVRVVFDRWRECRDGGKGPAPLLLLNEADAMVGRRVQVGHSVDQMHNIMQNVLLEELERFDGILVATTNLIDNIDGAFDRRFLYKLRFDLPCREERRRIWQSRMPKLEEEWTARLAAYPLSGAQIENVARRALINGLLKKRPELAELEAMAVAEDSFRKGKVCVMGFAPKDAKEQNEE